MITTYEINKGINRSIEFKGIKAQYIMYLAAGLIGLLLLFAILYTLGINIYFCLAIIVPSTAILFGTVQHYSKTYGEHGLIRKKNNVRMPAIISSRTRIPFIQLRLSKKDHESKKVIRKFAPNL